MKKITILILTILLIISSLTICVNAATIDPNDYAPPTLTEDDTSEVVSIANVIVGAIRVLGIVASVRALMVIGIKYMTGSISERAEYKKTMIPYIVGALIFFALTQLLGLIIELIDGAQSVV